jgi:3-oxoacyl-(acyl-carrier-protein) synthase
VKARVVVTGLGPIAPCGIGKERFWAGIRSGQSFVKKLNSFDVCDLDVRFKDVSEFQSQMVGMIDDFDKHAYGLNLQQLRRMDRFAQFAFVGSKLAVEDAGLSFDELDRNRVGVCVGNAIAGAKRMNEEFEVLTELGEQQLSPLHAHPSLYMSSVPHVANVEIASHYKLHGPSTCISTGCTSGIDSVGYAKDLIENGLVDVMIAGSVDAAISPATLASFDVAGALAKRNHEPDKASRPFDAERDGFVLAEGGGLMVLESLEHALKRNAVIYGEVLGFGTCMNAFHMTSLQKEGEDLARAIEISIEKSNVKHEDIGYINAHGSSTPQNDSCETGAYKRVFGDLAYKIPISSTKSVVGHSMGGASSMEIIVCIMGIYDNYLPPTINYSVPDEYCDLDYIPNVGRDKAYDVALTTASGFSGIHSSMLFRRYKG